MKSIRPILFSAGLAVSCLSSFSLPVEAQSQPQLNLGSDVTMPGQDVRIPLTLDGKELEIVAVQAEIAFPQPLSFVDAELADAGKSASAKLDAQLLDVAGEGGGSHKVVVKIEAPQGKVLSSGSLALVRFKVPADFTDSGDRDFKLDASVSMTIRGGTKASAVARGGTVTVLKGLPVVACFFYMH